jgi:prepilin-type N-terminal cleavage/methylation domain-containing protein
VIARAPRLRERGFTLIELMVALLVSTVLVGLVMSIYMRMSLAYRTQQQVSELQQVLQAAQMLIQRDIRQSGFQMSQGFRIASAPTLMQPPVQIINSAAGPDELRIYYADADAQARVTAKAPASPVVGVTSLTVDEASQFQVGDKIALVHVNRTGLPNPRGTVDNSIPTSPVYRDADGSIIANIAQYDTCVLLITDLTNNPAPIPDTVTVSQVAPWGMASNTHCAAASVIGTGTNESTMIYLFVGSAYRIDPSLVVARRQLAVLQRSPTGGLVANDWQDLGIGFTDLQVASRWFDNVPTTTPPGGACDQQLTDAANTTDTADSDTDVRREWYSGAMQATLTTPYEPLICPTTGPLPYPMPQRAIMTEVSISLALRTSRPVEGIASSTTPAFRDAARPDNGQVGDHDAYDLAANPDASRPEEYKGNHVYRYTTVRVDVRNVGVGL